MIKCILSFFLNTSKVFESLISLGKQFHICGPIGLNDELCTKGFLEMLTGRIPWVDDLSGL